MIANDKPKLTNKEMISHLTTKGITFEKMTEAEAMRILRQNTYFYKITAYRKNFSKTNGQYQGLDFAMLSDLAIIDMRLRYLLLEMSLDYEHAIKTKILDIITYDPNEDGYDIVRRFKTMHSSTYKNTVNDFHRNHYLKDMYKKRQGNIAIWTLLEVMSFGSLSILIDFMWKEKNQKSLKAAHNLHKYAKNIRNASAHSNPLLVNLYSQSTRIKNDQAVVSYASYARISYSQLEEKKINDIFSLIYLHKKYCSNPMIGTRIVHLNELLRRAERHKEWYASIEKLCDFYLTFKKMVDFLAD